MLFELTYFFNYFLIFFYIIGALGISFLLLFFALFLKYHAVVYPDLELSSAYECGFLPFDRVRTKLEVKFFMVALLFVVFDLEVIFIFPWALCLSLFSFGQVFFMFVFLTILVFSFLYELHENALMF